MLTLKEIHLAITEKLKTHFSVMHFVDVTLLHKMCLCCDFSQQKYNGKSLHCHRWHRSATYVVRYAVIINYFMHVSRLIGVKFNVAYALFAIIKMLAEV